MHPVLDVAVTNARSKAFFGGHCQFRSEKQNEFIGSDTTIQLRIEVECEAVPQHWRNAVL